MVTVRRISCEVVSIRDHGERVYTLELHPSSPVPRFTPGQFLHLAIDSFDPSSFWPDSRVFSIASSPTERDRLTVTYAVKGSFTRRMEQELSVGSVVWVKLPYGEFLIDPASDTVLFAGGTGVTAFTAFLQNLAPEHPTKVLLCYGARTKDLLIYAQLAEDCARRVPALEVRLFVEDNEGKLSVDAIRDTLPDLNDPVFYLAGPPQMIDSLDEQLSSRAVPACNIKIDAWK